MNLWHEIGAAIADATYQRFAVHTYRPVGGGCINRCYCVEGNGQRYFVKLNEAETAEMFAAEAEALNALHATATVRVPVPVCHGTAGTSAYLALEYLELIPEGASAAETLGTQLARLHRHSGSHYGWHRDNTIGSTPQINTPNDDWLFFWRERRLGYQLRLAAQQGYGGALQRRGERLLNDLGRVLAGHAPPPSLLHGDLWSGNHAALRDGRPVIFDPACYYGDREADLAMTELFGGFSSGFYAAYRDHYPLDEGYRLRKTLYNLYHVLNHLNLFGGGYGAQAERMINNLLSEVG
jgi:protein-ribulosamine 3-kinase